MKTLVLKSLDAETIARHHLQGHRFNETRETRFHDQWKKQLLSNQLTKQELEMLGQEFARAGIEPTLLKGFALLGDIYPDWGVRFASDVDLLIDSHEFARLQTVLAAHSYQMVTDKKWLGNAFKYQFIKKTDLLDFNIEVHFKLFWHCDKTGLQTRPSATIAKFSILQHEEMLMHLCGHLAFQHSFIKLFWLLDIDYYVKRYRDQINGSRFWKLAKENSLLLSCAICICLVNPAMFNSSDPRSCMSRVQRLQFYCLQKIVNTKFLLHPLAHPLRYILVKNLTKDHMTANLTYWKNWIVQKLRSKV